MGRAGVGVAAIATALAPVLYGSQNVVGFCMASSRTMDTWSDRASKSARVSTAKIMFASLIVLIQIPAGDALGEANNKARSEMGFWVGPPSINGATVFGVRPDAPLLFKVPATGQRPLNYSAENLPDGVVLGRRTGVLTGQLSTPGRYVLDLVVSNKLGKSRRNLVLRVGETICLTPPMGWNSWYCQSELVSEDAIRATAEAMVETGLIDHGWTYINIDDCWQGERGGPYNAIQPNDRFDDMKSLCDDLHAMGLKLGIYSTPWIGTYAGFVGGSAPTPEGDYSQHYMSPGDRLQPTQFFGRYPGSINLGLDRVGYWMFDRDARQWAEWGIDYVKVDWKPNDVDTTRRIATDLRACGRDIVLSLSNAAPYENIGRLSTFANCWRTTSDIADSWGSISGIAGKQKNWQQHTSPGHWNDMDMLQLGNLGVPNRQNSQFDPTHLSADEQRFHMSLWCLLQSPLLLSCDIASLDDYTLSLLTNDEVLAIHQDALAKPARFVAMANGYAWIKQLEDGDFAVGMFNTSNNESIMTVNVNEIGTGSNSYVRDLWQRKHLGRMAKALGGPVVPHGATLMRVSKHPPDVQVVETANRAN